MEIIIDCILTDCHVLQLVQVGERFDIIVVEQDDVWTDELARINRGAQGVYSCNDDDAAYAVFNEVRQAWQCTLAHGSTITHKGMIIGRGE